MNAAIRRAFWVALLAVCLSAPAAADAAFTGANGKIAFSTQRGIGVVEPDGSGFAMLSDSYYPRLDSRPAWSPNGERIAFVNGDAGFPASAAIWVMNADGTGRVQLTDPSYDTDPAWSPDGSKIVFSRRTTPGFSSCLTGTCAPHLFVMNSNGTGLTQITSGSNFETQPTWSPDGSRIAFTKCDVIADGSGCVTAIASMKPDGTDMTRLTEPGGRDPSWSPDGSRIAFGFRLDEIYTMAADGSDARRVTNSDSPSHFPFGWAAEPSWSPDGKRIAFTAVALGTCSAVCHDEIYTVTTEGIDYDRITDNDAKESVPDWQPLNQPPDCSRVVAAPGTLLPATRKFVDVTISGATDPEGGAVSLEVKDVTQDEPVTATGDPTSPDAVRGSSPDQVQLRAERNPKGDGRVYRLAFTALDLSGGTCAGTVTVSVPRHTHTPAVDSAPPSFDSFGF